MAKKKDYSEEYKQIVDNTKIVEVEVNDEMKKSFIAYAMAVNVSRAIPDVRDGLKPVHRRILYSMNEIGLTSDKPFRKCAKIVGDCLGKYHPHGDSSVYGALVRLAQDFNTRYPLVDGHGNFGSVDGDGAAAYRYTEARLAKISAEMLRDIDKETVDFYPNFDETLMQPRVLPSRFPNLLVNGSDGIAVGMATNIPPHNLVEVSNAIIAQIDNPDIDIEDLMDIIPAPDYPTGGIILGQSALKNAYRTGRGGVVIRSKCEIEEEDNGKSRIIVSEIPYQVNKAELIIQIADLVKNKKIDGISDIKEESDRNGMRIIIDIKKDFQANVVLNLLYKHTDLQVRQGIIFLALVDNEPKILNLKEILTAYIKHQKDVIYRRTKYDLARAEERAHIVEGLVIALANIDEVIAIIKASSDKDDAKVKLMESFELSDKQAVAILDMRLQRLTSLEVEKLNEELASLKNTIAELKAILADESKVLEIVKNELIEIRDKYGDERKTEISVDSSDIDIEDLIEREDVVVSMTHTGYIKRLPVTEYKSQNRGGRGVTAHKPKDEDFVEKLFITNTHDRLMFFTNFGKVYCVKAYEIPEEQKTSRGRAIINILPLEDKEKVNAVIPVKTDTEGNLMFATRKGMIKKTPLKEYDNIRKGGKIAINLNEGDELISVQITSGNDEVMVASSEGKIIRFNENAVRALGRDTRGVKSMRLAEDDYLVDMIPVNDESVILTVSENGYGKRTKIEEYKVQGRAGKGIRAGIFNEKTGRLVNLKAVTDNDDVMLIANNGVTIRLHAKSINIIGRSTQGVRIMKLDEKARVTCAAIADYVAEEVGEEDGQVIEISAKTGEALSIKEPIEEVSTPLIEDDIMDEENKDVDKQDLGD